LQSPAATTSPVDSTLGQDLASLLQAVESGNTTEAQADAAKVQNDLQNQTAPAVHHHHRHLADTDQTATSSNPAAPRQRRVCYRKPCHDHRHFGHCGAKLIEDACELELCPIEQAWTYPLIPVEGADALTWVQPYVRAYVRKRGSRAARTHLWPLDPHFTWG
jgi:hypothetical protein